MINYSIVMRSVNANLVTNFAPLPHSDVKVVQKMKRIFVIS